ncbi:MAG: hypothetical protein KAT10_00405 [Sulfurimonas sp.]|nr:hypothetical protein [Sulfurimonas sp.]
MVTKTETYDKLDVEKFKKIKLVGVSKHELIGILGLPLAVAKQNGTPMYIPKPFENTSKRLQPDVFFELFASKHDLDEHYVIYYYQHCSFTGYGLGILSYAEMPFFMPGKHITVDKLWVLIDERTQKVVDYRFGEDE